MAGKPGQTLLSKSHLIDCCPLWRETFPGAKFVGIVRHPKDVVPSWVALAQPAATMLTGWQTPQVRPSTAQSVRPSLPRCVCVCATSIGFETSKEAFHRAFQQAAHICSHALLRSFVRAFVGV